MAEFAAFAAVAILVPAALALLLDWLWPNAPTARLAFMASILLPLGLRLSRRLRNDRAPPAEAGTMTRSG